jgi:hypothetical protein
VVAKELGFMTLVFILGLVTQEHFHIHAQPAEESSLSKQTIHFIIKVEMNNNIYGILLDCLWEK